MPTRGFQTVGFVKNHSVGNSVVKTADAVRTVKTLKLVIEVNDTDDVNKLENNLSKLYACESLLIKAVPVQSDIDDAIEE
jgi:hypothetical protein